MSGTIRENRKKMKTIQIQLIKNLIFPMDKVRTLECALHTLYEYAPEDVYEYFILGKEDILMMLKTSHFSSNPVPVLSTLPAHVM